MVAVVFHLAALMSIDNIFQSQCMEAKGFAKVSQCFRIGNTFQSKPIDTFCGDLFIEFPNRIDHFFVSVVDVEGDASQSALRGDQMRAAIQSAWYSTHARGPSKSAEGSLFFCGGHTYEIIISASVKRLWSLGSRRRPQAGSRIRENSDA
jgi:hypothetical protein